MANVEDSILEIIQNKERELALRESEARTQAAERIERAKQGASEFLHEQTSLAEDEAAKVYLEKIAEIEIEKQQMLVSETMRLNDLQRSFDERFALAVSQVLQWVWERDEQEAPTTQPEAEAKVCR